MVFEPRPLIACWHLHDAYEFSYQVRKPGTYGSVPHRVTCLDCTIKGERDASKASLHAADSETWDHERCELLALVSDMRYELAYYERDDFGAVRDGVRDLRTRGRVLLVRHGSIAPAPEASTEDQPAQEGQD